ncbi:MAG: hypothetical protein MUP55_02910 [Candidatus Aenigmarchaeota archaeon]|nr:hypothetical protein [Candidatus Aenigmarchaeota archaeon]
MSYNPRAIILLNFGKYARDENGKLKEHPPSITQIPFIDYEGFSYLDGYLSKPEKTDRIVIEPRDLEYIQSVAGALDEFPVRVKCEGERGHCKNQARRLVVPYSIDYNRPEKVKKGGPDFINQTYILDSSFCCDVCAQEREYQKEKKVLKLDIGFRLPDSLTDLKKKREWNVDRRELHGKLRKIAYQLTTQEIDDMIDPRSMGGERAVITRYTAQEIVNKLLHIPENQLPRESEEYDIRRLRWHLSDADKKGQLHLHLGRPY